MVATDGCAAPSLWYLHTSFKYPGSQKGPVLSCCRGPVAHALLCGVVPLSMLPVLAEDGEVESMELLVLCLCIRPVRHLSVSSFPAPSSGPFPLHGSILLSNPIHSTTHSFIYLFIHTLGDGLPKKSLWAKLNCSGGYQLDNPGVKSNSEAMPLDCTDMHESVCTPSPVEQNSQEEKAGDLWLVPTSWVSGKLHLALKHRLRA